MHEAQHGQGHGHRVVAERENQVSADDTQSPARSVEQPHQRFESRRAEIDVGRRQRRFGAAVDPDTDGSRGESGGVVDSVANHHHRALVRGLADPLDLVFRDGAATARRRVEVESLEQCTDRSRMVAGKDLNLPAACLDGGQGVGGVRANGIAERRHRLDLSTENDHDGGESIVDGSPDL